MPNQNVMSPLAQRIEERKEDLGLKTIVGLSEKTEVSRAVLTNIFLNPKKSIMLATGILLAKGLECRLEWLMTGEGPKTDLDMVNSLKYKHVSPVVKLSEIDCNNIKEFLERVSNDEGRERYSCATGSDENTIAIRLDRDIERYPMGGLLFFDLGSTQSQTGKLVIATTSNDTPPEIMIFTSARNRKFLKSLSNDIPDDLKLIEMDENTRILGVFKAFSIV